MTATHHASGSDYAETDQEDKLVTEDTVLFCLVHPPWMCLSIETRDDLYGLKPPDSLVRDWNKEIINGYTPEVWKEIEYERRYKEHINTDKDAKQDIFRISMLTRNEDVCLMCQCQFYHFCIRRIVYEHLEENGDINP